MYLTKEEEKMYNGDCGLLCEWAMRFLAAYGDGLKAERLVKVSAACLDQIEDPSHFQWMLPSDLYEEFLKRKMAVPTYTATQADTEYGKQIGMSEKDYLKAKHLERQYKDMGVLLTASCAPYLAGWTPTFGSHVASIESSLYVYINSVFGARTLRESYPSIFAVALTGKTPYVELHTDEGRRGNLLVKVDARLRKTTEYDALGYHVGAFTRDWDRPVFTGIPNEIGSEELKSLGAALQMQGSVGLYHVVGGTPEAPTIKSAFGGDKPQDTITVGDCEIKEAYAKLSRGGAKEVDWVILGCPHYSIKQLARVANMLGRKKIHKDVKLSVCTAPAVRFMANRMGIKDVIESAGGRIVAECWTRGLPNSGITIATDSAKCAVYASVVHGRSNNVCFGTTEECINAAINKKWG
jgi:predicted aconitase